MFRGHHILRAAFALAVSVGVSVLAKGEGSDSRPTGATHSSLSCSNCHQVVASIGTELSGPSPMQACQGCHARSSLTRGTLGQTFHRDPSRACSDCHSFHQTSNITAASAEFRFSETAGLGLCAACHSPGDGLLMLSPGHQTAARLYHSNADALSGLDASQACLLCHSENRTIQIDGVELSAMPRFSERHTHPVGEFRPGTTGRNGSAIRQNIDPRLHLYNNRIECQTCHQLTALTRHRLVPFESPQALCNGCHVIN